MTCCSEPALLKEPAVVCQRHEKLRATQGELAGEIAQGVLKADEGSDLDRLVRHLQNDRFFAEIKIVRHEITDNPRKQRKRISQGDVFAKGDEMDLIVDLRVFRFSVRRTAELKSPGRFEMHRAQQKVAVVFFRKSADDVPVPLIGEEGARRGGFGPDEKVGLEGKGCFRQANVEIENTLFILEIAFLIDGHIRLHGGNAQGLAGGAGRKSCLAP